MKKYVGVKEVSEYTGLTVGTIYYYIHERKIPFYKFNGKPRFVLEVIDNAITGKNAAATG
jgi:excisionase family DNA binding protein